MGEREDLVARIGAIDTAVARARDEIGKALDERRTLTARLSELGPVEKTPSPVPGTTQALPATSPGTGDVPSNVTAVISPSEIAPGLHPVLRKAGTWEPHLVWSGTSDPPRSVIRAICGVQDDPRNWEYHQPTGDRIEVHTGCLQRMRAGSPA